MRKIPTRRNGYYFINGKEYVSVTKVLRDTLAKPALYFWSGLESARIALRSPELNEDEVMAELKLSVRKTQERGKAVHLAAVAISNNQPIATKLALMKQEDNGYIEALQSWFTTVKPVTISSEVEAYSDVYGFAGRCDYICKIGDEKWLIDFKSGKAIYQEVGLQLVAYRHMLSECNIIEIDKTGVLLLMETGEYKFQETVDTIQDFIQVKRVWDWMQKRRR